MVILPSFSITAEGEPAASKRNVLAPDIKLAALTSADDTNSPATFTWDDLLNKTPLGLIIKT